MTSTKLKWLSCNQGRRRSAALDCFTPVLILLLFIAPDLRADSPYASQLISENAAFGSNPLYNDPNAVLGAPTRIAVNGDLEIGGEPFRVKIIEAAYNLDTAGNPVVTTMSRKSNGAGGSIYASITVKFDHSVVDDPHNPYGIDLNIFGNSFYNRSGIVGDSADMRSVFLTGKSEEAVLVSVSPDNVNWYTYNSGPFGDNIFPTQGYEWNATQFDNTGNGWDAPTDFTKPVNPTLNSVLGVVGQPITAANAMATYVGSGGGTGIDLAPSGFSSIQYVRVQSAAPPYLNGEIDAFADVRPMRVGDALSITPANVTAGTRLYFQSATNEAHTAIAADFNTASGLLKLATSPVTDSAALAALAGSQLLTAYQLDVSPLYGTTMPSFTVDYGLSPGENYAGDGSDLTLASWNGAAWLPLEFTFDALTGRLTLADWSSPSITLAIVTQAEELVGDFNGDLVVDAADYVVWRKGIAVGGANWSYEDWTKSFGDTSSSGGSAGGSFHVPEPASALMLLLATATFAALPQASRNRKPRL